MKSFVKFRPKQSRRRQARLIPPWYAALERLEDRCLLAAPTISAPGPQTTAEDTAKAISGLSFADDAVDTVEVTITLNVTNGTLFVSGNVAGGVTSTDISGNGTATVMITALQAALNTTLADTAGVTFTPATDFNGSDSLDISINDNENGNAGTPLPASTNVMLNVTAVNDAPTFTITANPPSVDEDAGLQSIASFATAISEGPANESSQTITNFSVTPVASTGGLMFVIPPSIDPLTGALTYQAAADSNGTATFNVTLTDNGIGTAPNVNTSAAQTFIISVAAVNDAPSFTKGPNETVLEDAGEQIVSGWATDISAGTNEPGQTVRFTVVADTQALFSVQPAVSTTGELTYTPAENANGSTTITVTASDGSLSSAAQTFTINITAVNDAPTFTLAGNPASVNEDAGLQTVVSFATDITQGPTNESSQSITNFTVTSIASTGGLTFLTAPSVNPLTGTLTYQAAADSNGTATFRVTLSDNGNGTAPNANTSTAQTFVITVTSVNDAPTIAAPGVQTTRQGTAKVITGISFADLDAGTSNVTVTLGVTGGRLTVLGNVTSGVTTSQITGNGTSAVTITAPLSAINTTLANASGLTYTPNALFSGSETLSISINDNGNTGGAAQIVNEAVAIAVTPSNGATTITVPTPNVTYTAKGSARMRATVINGMLSVTINGIAYPNYPPDSIVTLTFNGGSGKDEINLTGLSEALYTNLARIVIKGNAGNDSLIGSNIELTIPVTQTINGDAGNDTLTGGVGDDLLNGGAGTDLLIQSGDVELTLTNTYLTGGLGMDRLTGVENVSLTGGDGDNMFDASAFTLGSVTLIGGDGKDELIGGSKNDAISGQDGDDVLTGGAGNDTISGGEGDDMLFGGQGNDLLIGGFGFDMVFGEGGNDTALGGQGGSARNGNGMKDDDGGGTFDIVVAEHINEAFKKLFAFE